MEKKVGLALGSGSLKGLAHIGILQVLQENKIPIDIIAGTSAGAIFGGIYAAGTDLYMLEKLAASLNTRTMLDLCGSRSGGLLKGDKIEDMIRTLTHDKSFDQTELPFACVAVDAEAGKVVVLQNGKLHTAIRASMSIPGVFVPIRMDGIWCIDGGVLERVPCRTLRNLGADVVIGVDVGYCGRSNPIIAPTVRSIVASALDIMQWELAKAQADFADVMLYPDVLFMGGLSMQKAPDCIKEGRRAAENALPDILALLERNEISLRA